jgi:hypothetical protein
MSKRLTVCVSLIILLASGCGGDPKPVARPSTGPTPIARLDSAGMHVVRVAFCDLVPKTAVRRALAATSVRTVSWRNGDPLPDAGKQVGHEFGCRWTGPRARVARAWVFARPVSPAYARVLVRNAGREHGCTTGAGPGFGKPAVVQTCLRAGSLRRIRHAGLFGATWLTCEVSGHGSKVDLRRRADAWCVSVANALNAG